MKIVRLIVSLLLACGLSLPIGIYALEPIQPSSVANVCPTASNPGQQGVNYNGRADTCDQEESRFTERYPWAPWIGIGFAAAILITLLALTTQATNDKSHRT